MEVERRSGWGISRAMASDPARGGSRVSNVQWRDEIHP